MKRKHILLLLFIGILVFLFFNFNEDYPETKTKISASDIQNMSYAKSEINNLLKVACFDCHSYNLQELPWYGKLPIVKGWMASHMIHGREHLNFSEWANYSEEKRAHKMEEISDKVTRKEMPLTSYLLGHKDARISDAERKMISDWAIAIKNSYEKD